MPFIILVRTASVTLSELLGACWKLLPCTRVPNSGLLSRGCSILSCKSCERLREYDEIDDVKSFKPDTLYEYVKDYYRSIITVFSILYISTCHYDNHSQNSHIGNSA